MELRRSFHIPVGVISVFLLSAFSSCRNQGTNFSFDQVSASAYSREVEGDYDALLRQYVDSSSFVRYTAWLAAPQDMARLKSILDAMSKTDESAMSADQRKAFYLNAYNAMTLDLILSHYEETLGSSGSPFPGVRSIRNIENLNLAVWDRLRWKIAGKPKSLNDIENRVLRPMGDARIHLAIVCASVGCPPIYNHAFTAANLNAALERLADAFVNSGKKTTFDRNRRVIHTSHILSWYGNDFVITFGSVQAFFARYVRAVPADEVQNYSMQFDDYDWTLNESSQGI